jgi:hypothetical protein
MSDEHQHNADHHHDHDHSHDDHSHDAGHNHDSHHHHEHGHDHDEGHTHGETGDLTKITALLDYMLDHNKHHAEELADMAHDLYHADLGGAAALVEAGVKDFETGNEKLKEALKLIKGGPS